MGKAKIFSNYFNRLLDATKNFSSKKCETRKWQEFIRLEFDAGLQTVTAISVDGYRMSIEHAHCQTENTFCAYIKPTVRFPKDNYVFIETIEDKAIISCNGFLFGYEQPSPSTLDPERVIPKNDALFKLKISASYLIDAANAAKASCKNSAEDTVTLEFRGPRSPLIIRTNNDDIKLVLPVITKEDYNA